MKPFHMGALLCLAALAAGPAASQVDPNALGRLEPGQWRLSDAANERAVHSSICVGDRLLLVQPQHGAAACTRTLIGSTRDTVTYRYSCPGAGSGQTTLRVETPRLAQVNSQGIANGVPFALRLEARRTGTCACRPAVKPPFTTSPL